MSRTKEDRLLDRQYMEWRAEEIKAGRIPRPPAPPYNPTKYEVPPIVEANRRTLGRSLPELEEEMLQFKAARASGQSINSRRLVDVHREIERLRMEEADIAWSVKQQADYEDFVRGPKGQVGGNVGKATTKRGKLFEFLGAHKKKIALAAGGALVFGLAFSGRDDQYNTIPGMHPGSEGMGAHSIRQHTPFGSGVILGKLFRATEQEAAEEGYKAYSDYKSPERRRAEKSLTDFAKRKENMLKFPGMGNSDTMAGRVRGQLTEFKEDFASRWDPLRKLAKQIYKGTDDEAFKQLTRSKEFREAVTVGLKTPGKKLGEGVQGQVFAHRAQMTISDKMHDFEFVVKKGLPDQGGEDMAKIIQRQESLAQTFRTEAQAMRALGSERAPSYYGHGRQFGLQEEAIVMEKFELGTPLAKYRKEKLGDATIDVLEQENPLSTSEVSDLQSFMKGAHKKGITHTDMHKENVVRAINPATGKEEIAVLDWGLANRFQEVAGVGGGQEIMTITPGGKHMMARLQEKIGRPVGFQEFSEAADLMRTQAHGMKSGANTRSSHLAVNAVYEYGSAQRELMDAEKVLFNVKNDMYARPALIADAEQALVGAQSKFANRKQLIEDVTDNMAEFMATGQVPPPRPIPAPISGGSSLEFSFNRPMSSASDNLEFSFVEALGSAKGSKQSAPQVISDITRKEGKRVVNEAVVETVRAQPVQQASAATIDHRARRAAIRRNEKFRKMSQQSVGSGLRASARATKGHAEFGSTTTF